MTTTNSLRDFHRDGTPSAAAALRIRQIRALGATVTWTKTNRVTCVASDGTRRVYAIAGAPVEYARTPLELALADLNTAARSGT